MACSPSQHFSAPSASGDPRILGPEFPKIWAGPIRQLSKGFMRGPEGVLLQWFCYKGFKQAFFCVCVCV